MKLALLPRYLVLLLLLLSTGTPYSWGQDKDKVARINKLLDDIVTQQRFNGSVLVMDGGKVLLNRSYGVADFRNNQALTPSSSFNLAGASEQFTAAAALKLKEQGKLNLEDEVTKYLPELSYTGLKVVHLLNHTSGLPDYTTLFAIRWDKSRLATNRDLLELMQSAAPALLFKPGERYQATNTDYALLATVVERASGEDLIQYLKQTFFDPLGMKETLVFNKLRYPQFPTRVFAFRAYNLKPAELDDQTYLEGIYGDKNLYSSIEDLALWERAIYADKVLKSASIAEMYAPIKLNNGEVVSGGYGWHMGRVEASRSFEQGGSLGGFRVVYERLPESKGSVVLLNNTGLNFLLDVKEDINAILKGKPYSTPKASIATTLASILLSKGVQEAVGQYASLKETAADKYDFRESELNTLGVELLETNRVKEAIEIFKLNVDSYPASFNVYDSLAEAYLADGDKEQAIANYKKSLELYSDNDNAREMIQKLSNP